MGVKSPIESLVMFVAFFGAALPCGLACGLPVFGCGSADFESWMKPSKAEVGTGVGIDGSVDCGLAGGANFDFIGGVDESEAEGTGGGVTNPLGSVRGTESVGAGAGGGVFSASSAA